MEEKEKEKEDFAGSCLLYSPSTQISTPAG